LWKVQRDAELEAVTTSATSATSRNKSRLLTCRKNRATAKGGGGKKGAPKKKIVKRPKRRGGGHGKLTGGVKIAQSEGKKKGCLRDLIRGANNTGLNQKKKEFVSGQNSKDWDYLSAEHHHNTGVRLVENGATAINQKQKQKRLQG